jgi:cob(I)alamin adenosyltransferase
MKLYTRKGDAGQTDLLGERVSKNDPRIDLIGTLDEATSTIGFARAMSTAPRLSEWLIDCQRDLYKIMAELAFTEELRPKDYGLAADRVEWLEQLTDSLSDEIELSPQFILPGDTVPGAAFDVARSVVRRAERLGVDLASHGHVPNDGALRYLNRLSSFLFMAARLEEAEAGIVPRKAKTHR